jgi:flagellar basal-body rod protein FlgG
MSSTPAGTEITSVSRNFKAGNLVSTGNALDLAIQGDGFFQVTLPDESIGYTRAGSLTVDATGSLVTKDGNKVYPDITIPQDAASLSVSANGIISATKADGTVEDLGALELGKFTNPDGLETIGSGVYKTTPASGDPVIDSPGKQGIGTIQQGYTESSNVDMVSEMVKMMMTQKSYEINAKVMQTTDTMMGIANGIKR